MHLKTKIRHQNTQTIIFFFLHWFIEMQEGVLRVLWSLCICLCSSGQCMNLKRICTGVPKKLRIVIFLTLDIIIGCCRNRIASHYLYLEYQIQSKSTITHANANTIAITIKNMKKSIKARMMKGENPNEYLRALALALILVVFRHLWFLEKASR